MESQAFYRSVALPNFQSDEEPLVVNCAGYCGFHEPFQTWNREGRADYYLQYVTHGCLHLWLDGTEQRMGPGSFLVTKPRTPYRYFLPAVPETNADTPGVNAASSETNTAVSGENTAVSGENTAAPGEMGYLWVHFTGFHAGRLLSNLQLEPGQIYSAAHSLPEIRERFASLFAEFSDHRGQRGFDEACAVILTQILLILSRSTATENRPAEKKLTTLSWLHQHFQENLSMGQLAAMEHLSESRYRSVFRRQTGLSPSEYRTALRIQHACNLLSSSDRSITDISVACGYSDVLYFTRLFKQKIGVPPGKYRAQLLASP